MASPPHSPLDARIYPRFSGIRTFMRLPHVTDLAGADAAVRGAGDRLVETERAAPEVFVAEGVVPENLTTLRDFPIRMLAAEVGQSLVSAGCSAVGRHRLHRGRQLLLESRRSRACGRRDQDDQSEGNNED